MNSLSFLVKTACIFHNLTNAENILQFKNSTPTLGKQVSTNYTIKSSRPLTATQTCLQTSQVQTSGESYFGSLAFIVACFFDPLRLGVFAVLQVASQEGSILLVCAIRIWFRRCCSFGSQPMVSSLLEALLRGTVFHCRFLLLLRS